MRKLSSGRYFKTGRPQETFSLFRSDEGDFYVISDVRSAIAVDEYGEEDTGFSFDARPATGAEIESWKEARREARGSKSVWDLIEEHTSEH